MITFQRAQIGSNYLFPPWNLHPHGEPKNDPFARPWIRPHPPCEDRACFAVYLSRQDELPLTVSRLHEHMHFSYTDHCPRISSLDRWYANDELRICDNLAQS